MFFSSIFFDDFVLVEEKANSKPKRHRNLYKKKQPIKKEQDEGDSEVEEEKEEDEESQPPAGLFAFFLVFFYINFMLTLVQPCRGREHFSESECALKVDHRFVAFPWHVAKDKGKKNSNYGKKNTNTKKLCSVRCAVYWRTAAACSNVEQRLSYRALGSLRRLQCKLASLFHL